MTKPLHVGRAAQNGVMAAELAARGFTGGKDALDPPWGFFQVFSHGEGFDADAHRRRARATRTRSSAPGVSIKPYPCGVLGHPTMDAMRRLVIDARRAAGADHGDPRARRARTSSTRCATRSRTTSSRRSSARRSWSAAIALRRKAGIHEFTDEFVQSAPVQAMMAQGRARARSGDRGARAARRSAAPSKSISPTAARSSSTPTSAIAAAPTGRSRATSCYEKFSDCASLVLPPAAIDEVFELVDGLEQLADITTLVRALTAPRANS